MSVLDTGARSRSSINFDITTRALRDMINSRLFGKGTFNGNHSDVQIVANDLIDPQTLRAKYRDAALPVQDLYRTYISLRSKTFLMF